MNTEEQINIEVQLDILFDCQRAQNEKWKSLANILDKEFVTMNDLKVLREQLSLPYKNEQIKKGYKYK